MKLGRDIFLIGLILIIVSSSFSLQVTKNHFNGNTTVNNTICSDFGIINDNNYTYHITLTATGEISGITLFNTTTLDVPSNTTKYFKACFTPTQVGQFNGSININNSGTIYPILISITSNVQQGSSSGSCSLLPSISQYNSRLSQGTNTSFVVHIKNTCSQPITSISATIQNAKPDFAYITGNIPGTLNPGQTLDVTVNVDGSKETEGQHNFYLTVSGFEGNNRISTNVNFNIYIVAQTSPGTVSGTVGQPSVNIPGETYVNQTYQIAVTGISSSDLVFIDIQPTNIELKSIDRGIDYYKADYVFDKEGQYSIIVKVYHAGALYYQTSKNVIVHPPSYTNSSGSNNIAKILWLVRNKIEVHQSIRVEVRTEGGDPVDKAWVKITLPDGNFLSGDTDQDGVVTFSPQAYGYKDGFPEGTATIEVRKTGFAEDMSSPRSITLYRNRISSQLILSPSNLSVGEQATVKLINKDTGELIDYNGEGKATSQNETITLQFKDGVATFTPNYNETYTITVNKNNLITGATTSVDVTERIIKAEAKGNNNLIIYGAIGLFILIIVIVLMGRGKRKNKPTFRYGGLGKVGSFKSSGGLSLPGEEENVVEVVGENK